MSSQIKVYRDWELIPMDQGAFESSGTEKQKNTVATMKGKTGRVSGADLLWQK